MEHNHVFALEAKHAMLTKRSYGLTRTSSR